MTHRRGRIQLHLRSGLTGKLEPRIRCSTLGGLRDSWSETLCLISTQRRFLWLVASCDLKLCTY